MAGLDPAMRVKLLHILDQLHQRGVTLLLATRAAGMPLPGVAELLRQLVARDYLTAEPRPRQLGDLIARLDDSEPGALVRGELRVGNGR